MRIPTQKECFELITKMDMMDHIVDHSIMVSNVSLFLSNALSKHYPDINTQLVTSAALLHDITKTRSFATQENHSLTGGDMLTQMGYPEVGNIIRQHVFLDTYKACADVTMEEIVNYSDKRVLHDQIVSLNKRMEYIKIKYATSDQLKKQLAVMWAKTRDLETKLFSLLEITPDQLSKSVLHTIAQPQDSK